MSDLSQLVEELFEAQFTEWELARRNYDQLAGVRVRTIPFSGYEISVQFNPGRITSSSAKVDARSVAARPCFLCSANRPPEQRGIPFGNEWVILVNPFPIFPRHLTIVFNSHVPQRIAGNMDDMLAMARALPGFVIFYNGPQCGASAPDHLHFQAGSKGFLPIERDISESSLCSPVRQSGSTELSLWRGYNRAILTLRGSDAAEIVALSERFTGRFALLQPERPEPMLNILASYDEAGWTVHLIPRRAHRPACYFAEGDEKILLSPASVDLGGVFITPREEDFNKIASEDIRRILGEVCLAEEDLISLINDMP